MYGESMSDGGIGGLTGRVIVVVLVLERSCGGGWACIAFPTKRDDESAARWEMVVMGGAAVADESCGLEEPGIVRLEVVIGWRGWWW